MKERPLRVTLVKDGEPFPQFIAPWTLRSGNLAVALAERGHNVTWYCSTFMHYEKSFYTTADTTEERPEGYRMRLLHSGGYQRNISPQRYLHHARLGRKVYRELRENPTPDVIVCCVPIIETALACWLYARQHKVPLMLDIQDPWPEVFVTYAPARLQPLIRAALSPYFALAGYLFAKADSVVSCSDGFLEWAHRLSGRTQDASRDRVFYHGAHDVLGKISPDPVLSTTGLRSLYAGAISRTYDLNPVLQYATKAAERGDEHHLFLAGQGDRYQELRERYERLPNVSFLGWLQREQVYALAQTCHLGWLPLADDRDDFLPNKPFEYAALGLAIASSSRGEAGRLIERFDLGLSYQDADDLARQLSSLTPSEPRLKSWQENGRRFFASHGDAKVCAAKFADHVEDVAKDLGMREEQGR